MRRVGNGAVWETSVHYKNSIQIIEFLYVYAFDCRIITFIKLFYKISM